MFAVPLIASVICVFILGPVVNYFEIKGMKRIWVITGLYLSIIVVVTALAVFAAPAFVRQTQTFLKDLPQYEEMLLNAVCKLQNMLQDRFPQLDVPDLNEMVKQRIPRSGAVNIGAVMAYSSSLFSILSVLFIIPVVTFFLLADGHMIEKLLLSMVPNQYFEMIFMLFHKITMAIRLFLRGQMIDAGAVGVMIMAGLSIVGMPYAVIIGIIAGLGNLIPYLGPVIGFIPAFFIMMATGGFSMIMLVKILSVFALVQFVESTFIYPVAVGKSVNLHPLVVIIGVTVGGQVAGIPGMLLVIPVISVLKVSIEVLYSGLRSYNII
jgi:putative permease